MSQGPIIPHEKVTFNLAKIKKEGLDFEVVVDPDLAIKFAEGGEVDVKDILKSEHVFSDAKKGDLASEQDLKRIFETDDPIKVATIILKDGEIQLTAEHRQKVRDQKMQQIMQIIHRNGVDPKTHLPHPMTRLQNAFDEAKIKIEERRTAEDQVQDVLNALRVVLPIKFELKEMALHIPSNYAGKAFGVVKSFGSILKDEWQNDGSWVCVVEIPGGLEGELYDKLNNLTHGDIESKIVKTK